MAEEPSVPLDEKQGSSEGEPTYPPENSSKPALDDDGKRDRATRLPDCPERRIKRQLEHLGQLRERLEHHLEPPRSDELRQIACFVHCNGQSGLGPPDKADTRIDVRAGDREWKGPLQGHAHRPRGEHGDRTGGHTDQTIPPVSADDVEAEGTEDVVDKAAGEPGSA